jgi:DNA polymerase delta subunit 2
LEDESGRLFLTGDIISEANLVTGLVVAVLGAETAAGDFQVQDICYPGAAPQEPVQEAKSKASMEVDAGNQWVAMVSGLNIGPPSSSADFKINLLVEYLLGEVGIADDQHGVATITRLIVAGDSFAPVDQVQDGVVDSVTVPGELADISSKKAARKYGYDASTFSVHPTLSLSGHLSELSRAMTVHLMPGASDPSSITLPQQPLPRAMFGSAKNYENFHVETNPCWIGVGTCQYVH